MDLTFECACHEFLDYQKRILKLQTYILTERNFKLHIIPYFKNKKICDITKKDILNWQALIENKGLSTRFNNSLQTKICQLYDFLADYFDLEYNFVKELPRFKNKVINNKKCDVWSFNEFKKFIKATKKDNVYHALFNFLFFSGCRINEALALQFKDIDNNLVLINKSLSKEYVDKKRVIQSTKNNKARKVRIDFRTRIELRRLHKYYIKQFGYCNSNFYIFGGLEPLPMTNIKRKKDYYCKKAGVKQIRIHDFRHSHATMLYQKTKDLKLVSERLGHSSVNITIDTYIHNFDKEQKKATKALNLLRLNIF